jgi:hypothetical protein
LRIGHFRRGGLGDGARIRAGADGSGGLSLGGLRRRLGGIR